MSVAWEEYGNYATDVFTRQAVNVIEVSDFNHLPPILCCCHPLSPNLRLLTLILSGAHDKPIAISYAYCHLVLLTVSGHQKHNSSQPIFLYVVLILILVPYLILLTLILSGPQHQPALVPLPRPPGRPLRQHLLSIAGDT